MNPTKFWLAVLAAVSCTLFGNARSEELAATMTYGENLKITQTIQPQGGAPFGEDINLYTGEVSFRNGDVVLEGTGPAISLIRESSSISNGLYPPIPFGDWTLSIPRIETLTNAPLEALPLGAPGENWVMAAPGSPNRYARCSKIDIPYTTHFLDKPWWFGIELITETGERQPILKRLPGYTSKPTMPDPSGQTTYPIVTAQNWQIGCLSQTSNGQAGEGFFAVSPSGTKYWFDYLTGDRARTITENVEGFINKQPRMLGRMYVSRIEDRFGNWLSYQYTGDMLTAIIASDGRSVSIAWVPGKRLIDKITAQPAASQPRVWQYTYTELLPSIFLLSQVILPDLTRWTFNLHQSVSSMPTDLSKCNIRGGLPVSSTPSTFSVSNPMGLTGSFTFRQTWHAHSYVSSSCRHATSPPEFDPYEENPPLYFVWSLVGKEISGPGIAPQTWTYAYSPAEGSTTEDPCAATQTCMDRKWVDVIGPDGNRTRYTHGNRSNSTNDGQLLQTDAFQGAATLLRSDSYTYAAYNQGPWPASFGDSLTSIANRALHWMPLKTRTTSQQGVTFTWQVSSFDTFAQPTGETRSNTLGYSRTDATAYYNDTAKWVLGQPASSTNTNTGLIESQTDYDSNALPWKTYAFGKLQQTMTYNADGTLATVKDGNNNVTSFANWKRGIPQTITFADGTVKSAVVNDFGWIASVTDENAYTTSYSYDVMGRLTSTVYPGGDTPAWNTAVQTFAPEASAEFGLPAGHWKQVVSNGNARQETYFDALWRPVLERRYDAADPTGTLSEVVRRYDADGQPVFESYPTRGITDINH